MRKKIRERVGISITVASGVLALLVGTKSYYDKAILLEAERVKLKSQEEASDAINALLDDHNFGYAIADSDGKIIEWNPALERITGWTKVEILEGNLGLHDVIPIDMRNQHYQAFQKAFEAKDGRISIVECEIPPHGLLLSPTKIRVTVRVVTTRHGTKYAIAHIDSNLNVIRKRVVVKFPERVLVPKKKKEETANGTEVRPDTSVNVTAGPTGS